MFYSEVRDEGGLEKGPMISLKGSRDRLILGNQKLGLTLAVLCDYDLEPGKIKHLEWYKTYLGEEFV